MRGFRYLVGIIITPIGVAAICVGSALSLLVQVPLSISYSISLLNTKSHINKPDLIHSIHI